MKKTAIHGLWFAAALGAFGAGKFSNRQTPPDVAGAPGTRTYLSTQVLGGTAGGTKSGAGSMEDESTGKGGKGAKTVFEPFQDNEIAAIASEAFSDPNPLKRQLAFARLLEGLTPENAELIREQMRGGKAQGDQWRLFQYAWGAADGEGALAAASAIENKDRRNGALGSALSGWASADPAKAISWLGSMEDGDEKNRLQDSLVGGLADYDIGTATNYVLKLADAGDKRAAQYMETVASEQIRKDGYQTAATWAGNLPAGDAKGAALDRVANTYVARDAEGAAAWAAQFADKEYGARVIEEVGDEWAERDPAASVAWLESLNDGQGKSEGMSSALGEWARRDPTAASEYLNAMPASDLKDTAVNGFVRRVAWEDPESAIVWANSISQEDVRNQAMTRAAQAYFVRDREAALQWLPNSGLSEEAQLKVLETRNDRRGRRGGRG
ncbi:MAG: hypothetical protein R3F19_28455 [Verrucomicrobiales bacterium]